jgi:hypothetical protein
MADKAREEQWFASVAAIDPAFRIIAQEFAETAATIEERWLRLAATKDLEQALDELVEMQIHLKIHAGIARSDLAKYIGRLYRHFPEDDEPE